MERLDKGERQQLYILVESFADRGLDLNTMINPYLEFFPEPATDLGLFRQYRGEKSTTALFPGGRS